MRERTRICLLYNNTYTYVRYCIDNWQARDSTNITAKNMRIPGKQRHSEFKYATAVCQNGGDIQGTL